MADKELKTSGHFIKQIIDKDVANGKHDGNVCTRFPPEPNGFLHIGHAKSICLNFGLVQAYEGGVCNLRFDDTNPEKEEQVYIDAIQDDVKWLGYQWNGPVRHASAYFDELYNYALELIKSGKAYVCSLSPEEARQNRGSLTEPGVNSPYRDRSVEENLDLLERMKSGEFPDGAHALRAKIDMASPNLNMRDPILYRIRNVEHHQTGNKWCIYPMYDFTHPISDALEGITHSLCTLEFEDHRPLYDWVLDNITIACHPQQIEFARLNLNYTVTSKRKLKKLVDDGIVAGWDDPRMPTIAGMRRRGFTPESIRNFCESVGITRSEGIVDVAMLEHAIRDDLNNRAPRAMCVLNPIKLTLRNYPEDQIESLEVPVHPQIEEMGKRAVYWSRNLLIDADDFAIEAPKKWKRLAPDFAVRLRGGYVVTCKEFVTNDEGEVIEVIAEFDPETLGKNPEGYKAKGVIHWVCQEKNTPVEVRLYDRLFNVPSPDGKGVEDFTQNINPESLTILSGAVGEYSLSDKNSDLPYQFEREGYFYRDDKAESNGKLVFNRTVTLRDSWSKIEGK
ncbi:MAG: glutamine--tRNA ligase/YqeY domain fusion protein [Pseudomonadales bacterium]|nr:glutamine--tRNA ligase/YqeY domain fusion protein [Pseudomonadales bacterium]